MCKNPVHSPPDLRHDANAPAFSRILECVQRAPLHASLHRTVCSSPRCFMYLVSSLGFNNAEGNGYATVLPQQIRPQTLFCPHRPTAPQLKSCLHGPSTLKVYDSTPPEAKSDVDSGCTCHSSGFQKARFSRTVVFVAHLAWDVPDCNAPYIDINSLTCMRSK